MVIKQPKLGEIVRYHRKRAGLTQVELAKLIGVGKTVIYDLEKGKETIQLNTLSKILEGLNISVELRSQLMDEFNHAQS
ncbi:MAG TPA: type II toxin-antitoxin system Y4mF family antitoxin [Cyclobacteriaceae bacterium]|nr:type II toxin-antitoxin system Y4mF family antitoxin [Cyclobacteriaceae bacterium]HRJ80712.1 type II toxin-antitoxin system Y4mF family antitoxin [Cyclobacteriaceae bacterium]